MKYLSLFLAIFLLTFASCKDDDDMATPCTDNISYLIVGTYYGECFGNCTFLYLLEDGKLYEDNIEIIIPENIAFKDTALSANDYDLAKELLDVPDDITLSDNSVWGCPDCADQGGVYLEIGYDLNLVSKYRIDTRNDDLTADIVAYKDRVLQIVNELRD